MKNEIGRRALMRWTGRGLAVSGLLAVSPKLFGSRVSARDPDRAPEPTVAGAPVVRNIAIARAGGDGRGGFSLLPTATFSDVPDDPAVAPADV